MKQKNKDRLFVVLVLITLFTGGYLMLKADRKNGKTRDDIFNEWTLYHR